MIDIALQNLNKYYGSNHVLRDVSFEIYNGEKIGLLGKNGSGKTTLFKILAQDEDYDGGSIIKASGKQVEILSQIPVFGEHDTVMDILLSSFKEVTEAYVAMKKIEGDSSDAALSRYGRLLEEYERLGGYDVEMKIDKICNNMSIAEEMKSSPFALLSGGEKTRINLARILLRDCDILLLDEPTNHLDLASLSWLEGFLRDFSGTVVVVSHDRVFLDNVVSRIIEIEEGKAHFYTGNYSFYAEEKRRRVTLQSEQYERQQKEIKRIEDRAKWFVANNRFTTKHHAILSRIDHMDKVEKPNAASRKITENFDGGGYSAKEAVSLADVCKSYGDNTVLENVSLSIDRHERIALIGENGCGKTTLVKLIMGEEAPDSGLVKVSSNVRVAYLPQIVSFDDENADVLATLREATGQPEEKARSILASFNFRGLDVLKKVGKLSGGEKSRLKLCLLMQEKVNFLILDEPTNHLDIQSREWIEDAVWDWDCTLLFISHDRFFLNKFADKIWSMKNGSITEFYGNFEDFQETESSPIKIKSKPTKKKNTQAKATKEQAIISPEMRIYEVEAELEEISKEIEKCLSDADYQRIDELYQKKYELEEQLVNLYAKWQ